MARVANQQKERVWQA